MKIFVATNQYRGDEANVVDVYKSQTEACFRLVEDHVIIDECKTKIMATLLKAGRVVYGDYTLKVTEKESV